MFKWIKSRLSRKETPNIVQGSFLKYEDALNAFEEEHGEYYVEMSHKYDRLPENMGSLDVKQPEFAVTILNSDLPPEVIEPVITDEWLGWKDEWLGWWSGPLETNGYEEDWNYG